MTSYLSHLECTICGAEYSAGRLSGVSPCCGKVLYARYDLARIRAEVDRDRLAERTANMWRFAELLPVEDPDNIVTLGEGGTPLIRVNNLEQTLGVSNLYVKEEGLNPTGTFKARGISAAISKGLELGAAGFTMPSAGNAAGAAAAYCARAGLSAKVFMPQDAPDSNKKECLVAGSELNLVDGLIGDAGRQAVAVAQEQGLFDLSTLKEPYRAEGKKSMGLELAMQLGWKMPDTIIYPAGGGTGIIGMHKGFLELLELGWIEGRLPRFVAVQAEGCQPIVKAFKEGKPTAEPWPNAATIADGLRVPGPFADYLMLSAIRETGGTALAVADHDMIDAMYELATAEGIFACPEGAATLVGYKRLLDEGFLSRDETVVLFNTGSGYKYLQLVSGEPRQ
jgi:threonine synthase